jgi:hypothetical protein
VARLPGAACRPEVAVDLVGRCSVDGGAVSRLDEKVNTGYPLVRGFVNLFVSPGKGLFWYAPVVIVAVMGALTHWRRLDWRHALLVAIVLANAVTVARLPVWSGDQAWGPRYMQVVLPMLVALAAMVVERIRWRRAIVTLGVVGFALPAMLGVLLCFNVFLIKASGELGRAPVASEHGVPNYIVQIRHDPAWSPLLGNAKLLPRAIGDVFGAGDGHRRRGGYSTDPYTFYGYFGNAPRIDFWWLWIGPTNGSKVTYLLFIPISAAGGTGLYLLTDRRRRELYDLR